MGRGNHSSQVACGSSSWAEGVEPIHLPELKLVQFHFSSLVMCLRTRVESEGQKTCYAIFKYFMEQSEIFDHNKAKNPIRPAFLPINCPKYKVDT